MSKSKFLRSPRPGVTTPDLRSHTLALFLFFSFNTLSAHFHQLSNYIMHWCLYVNHKQIIRFLGPQNSNHPNCLTFSWKLKYKRRKSYTSLYSYLIAKQMHTSWQICLGKLASMYSSLIIVFSTVMCSLSFSSVFAFEFYCFSRNYNLSFIVAIYFLLFTIQVYFYGFICKI